MRPLPEPRWTVAQLATAWHVSKSHVYDLIRTGELAAEKSSPRRTRIRESAADAYLARNASPKQRHLRLVA
jgi:excisionase family DNA binding protein